MVEEKEKLIQMPDSLLENPPEPRRKDIADLFAEIVGDEGKKGMKKKSLSHIFYLDFSNDDCISISSKSALLGNISKQSFDIYSVAKKIFWYIYTQNKTIQINSPYDSNYLSIILDWIGIKKAKKILIKLEKNKNLLKLEYR